ncbi:MAG: FkbM family methyltransferase [Acetobacteraceae bacterium]|nr:FkbM family methyltransferase [Acetobacteraceae bacterium]
MLKAALRRTALLAPPLRRLVERLQATEAALQDTQRRLDAVLAERAPPLDVGQAISQASLETFRSALAASAPESWMRVQLNGALLWLPRDTLRTMVHCMAREADGTLALHVEETHLRWMMERLDGGGTFLDVGCATGATTLPVARAFGERVRIVAYEPAAEARRLLTETLARNGISGVELRPVAVSDQDGSAEFREYMPDETGEVPFMPEASTLIGTLISERPHRMATVPVVTLDSDALPRCGPGRVVAKIDVEGFEAFVLRGAARLLAERRPWLSIDIHHDPFGQGDRMTEPDVRAILAPAGYEFTRIGHVLLCTPPEG